MTPRLEIPIVPGTAEAALAAAREEVREGLGQAAQALGRLALPLPALDGKALRPLAAYLAVPREHRHELDERFWMGALAVEMVHEASLLHDDILDEAAERRGRPTVVASSGVGAALVLGDHLLTSAYRAALLARSPVFLETFITAVERTVAGEIAQERSQGQVLAGEEYRRIITGKSGELFRAVFALPAALLGRWDAERAGELGARLGRLYQMADDFLDYCPGADRGKPPLQDYRQKKWTWPLGLVQAGGFEAGEEEILGRLFGQPPGAGGAPMEEGVRLMEEESGLLLRDLEREGMEPRLLGALLGGWTSQMRAAAEGEVAARHLRAALAPLRGDGDWLAYFARHGRSFRFASFLFPPRALRQVAGVYAFCRFTDDLVDEAVGEEPAALGERLDAWLALARRAHQGETTGIPLLDEVAGEAGRAGVPFGYLQELVEGVRMDLTPRSYRSLAELREYSHRVAAVVGGWLTELFGVRDPRVLERAFALGHAMQLTNILRDVGEDLRRGRLYLPLDRMAYHGVDRDFLEAMAGHGGTVFPGYRALLEELMAAADADYQRALEALPALPPFFRRPVAVAARVYRGIHDAIRRNGYDNLTRRAATSLPRKLWLGGSALLSLWGTAGPARLAPHALPFPPQALAGEERQEAAA